MRKRRVRKQEEKRDSERDNTHPLTKTDVPVHNPSLVHSSVVHITMKAHAKSLGKHPDIIVTLS
jgi:hypothetical protein